MYAVVGCDRCSALWVVEDRPETTQCPRCHKRHRYETRQKFVRTEDPDRAREARAAMLADRGAPEDVDLDLDFGAIEREAERADGAVSDDEYLAAAGLDPEEIADAGGDPGEPAAPATGGGSSRSRRTVVLDALSELERPTEADVLEYADGAGVPADYAREALAKLTERGEVTESDGRYRLL